MSSYIFETVDRRESFPANVYITSIRNSSLHWHYEYELIMVLKGNIRVQKSAQSLELKERDILLINSRSIHEIQSEEGGNICLFIQIDPSLFQRPDKKDVYYSFYLNSAVDEVPPRVPYSVFLKRAAKIGQHVLQKEEQGYFRMRAEVYALVADILEYTEYDLNLKQQKVNDNAGFLMQMIDYLKEHMQDTDVTETLYKNFGVGEKTVYRYLKSYTGMTVGEMLNKLKLDKAKRLLKTTEKNMGYIMDICGFGSEKTFYRMFRKDTGLTPGEYRQQRIRQKDGGALKDYLSFETAEAAELIERILEE